MKKILLFPLIGFLGLHLQPGALFINGQGAAYAQGGWKQEFAEVCGNTPKAMEFSPDELRGYIDRCNKLESRIHELNGPQGSEKKVYAKRLKMCKDLYVYALEIIEKNE